MSASCLKLVDDLGVADNTIVVYTTDNGAEVFTWPDGGTTPFKGEKATNWEGAFRVPCLIRWPGVIKPGTIVNDICAHEDFIPTFAAAAGEPDLVDKLKKGAHAERQDLQGPPRRHNLLPFFKGDANGIAARGLPLLERRRRPDGAPRPRLEDRLHGAAHRSWSQDPGRRLAGPLHQAARPYAVQLALRSVRARALQHALWRLDVAPKQEAPKVEVVRAEPLGRRPLVGLPPTHVLARDGVFGLAGRTA